MILHLTRRATFSAAHSCRIPGASDEESRRVFGDAARVHGHNYVWDLTLRGALDPSTGMVTNIASVKAVMEEVLRGLDSSWIDRDHPAFADRVPTTENLALYLWGEAERRITGCEVARVRLSESPTLWSEYTGMPKGVVRVTRVYDFAAAHRLHNPELSDEENRLLYGKCNNPAGHGHNYGLEVTVSGPVDERTGTVTDIARLNRVIQERILDRYDHRHLNEDLPEYRELNPTSENLAVTIWRLLEPELGPALFRVRVVETERNSFEYYGDR